MNAFCFFAERSSVKNFGDDFRGLRDRHSGTVEEQISIREYDFALAYGPKFAPPRMTLHDGLLSLTALQVESAGRNDQVLRIRIPKLLGRDGGGVLAFFPEQKFAIRDLHQLRAPVSHRE